MLPLLMLVLVTRAARARNPTQPAHGNNNPIPPVAHGGVVATRLGVCVCVLQAVPWDEVYNEIAAREMALLDALVGGKGLEEHMETFYLASLQQAVTRSAVSVVADAAASASASAGAQGQQQKV